MPCKITNHVPHTGKHPQEETFAFQVDVTIRGKTFAVALLQTYIDDTYLKAEDIAASQKCYSHSVHDKGGNTSIYFHI